MSPIVVVAPPRPERRGGESRAPHCTARASRLPGEPFADPPSSSIDRIIFLAAQESFGYPLRRLRGHSHYVEDVVISSDGQFALSGSWDHTLRLWDLNTGTTTRRFLGHTKDVLSVAFSSDNRQIMSGSRDRTIKLWNTLGECKYTIQDQDGHSEWVSCVRFSPTAKVPFIVSCGWDKMVKVWNLTNCKLRTNLAGHTGYCNTVTISPDGSLCASGGKDGVAILWDLADGKRLYSLDAGDIIHNLCFSPNRYWLCAATQNSIKIWDLESKTTVDELRPEFPPVGKKAQTPYCTSLALGRIHTLLRVHGQQDQGVERLQDAVRGVTLKQPKKTIEIYHTVSCNKAAQSLLENSSPPSLPFSPASVC